MERICKIVYIYRWLHLVQHIVVTHNMLHYFIVLFCSINV